MILIGVQERWEKGFSWNCVPLIAKLRNFSSLFTLCCTSLFAHRFRIQFNSNHCWQLAKKGFVIDVQYSIMVQPHKSQKWIYKIKLLQIDKVIVSNCCFILSQVHVFDLIVRVNIFDKMYSFICSNLCFLRYVHLI